MILENEKLIDASPAIVWRVTIDVERWPQWTPSVEKVIRLDDGPFAVGSSARIKQPGLPEAVWRVTSLEPGAEFSWETRLRGMHMVGTHRVIPAGSGTQSILQLQMSGLVARLLWPLIRQPASRSLEQENLGLKTLCERIAQELGHRYTGE